MERSPSQTDSRQQLALAIALLMLAGLLGYRAYGPRFAVQPTQELTGTQKPIDLNRADRAELVQIPGVGPHLADAILNHRSQLGRFENLGELQSVRGVGPKTLEKLRPWFTVEPGPIRDADEIVQLSRKPVVVVAQGISGGNKVRTGETRINVNAASETELQRLPGIGPTLANRIVLARENKRFETVDDMRKVKGIGAKTLENIRPYIAVEAR